MKKQKSKLFSFKYFLHDLIRVTAIPGILFFRPKVVGKTKEVKKTLKGGALIISNHIGLFDPMFLMIAIWNRRHHFVAAKELFDGKFRTFLFNSFLCIPIDRENVNISTLRNVTDHLNKGEVVSMFPEGHVNENGNEDMAKFKSGMVLMALQGNAPILPVYIKKRKHWYSRLKVAIGEPINVKEIIDKPFLNIDDINKITLILEQKEAELQKTFD